MDNPNKVTKKHTASCGNDTVPSLECSIDYLLQEAVDLLRECNPDSEFVKCYETLL